MTTLIDSTLASLEKESVKVDKKEEVTDGDDEEEVEEERVELMRVETPNPLLPALSSALEVAYKPEVGRHLVATRDIGVGEVVAVEEATLCRWAIFTGETLILAKIRKVTFARLLPTPALASTCCHCLLESFAPLPCPTCAAVSFCSQSCQNAALSSHHRWECSWALGDLATTGNQGEELACSSLWLAVRALTQKPVNWMIKNKELFRGRDPRYAGEDDVGLNKEQAAYKRLFSLVTHLEPSLQQKAGEGMVEKHTVLAVLFLCLLERSGWLEEHGKTGWTESKEVIAGQLFHLLAVVKFNTHQVLILVKTVQPNLFLLQVGQFDQFCLKTGYTASSIGQAVRPSLAFANHSCNPNMVRADRGR